MASLEMQAQSKALLRSIFSAKGADTSPYIPLKTGLLEAELLEAELLKAELLKTKLPKTEP